MILTLSDILESEMLVAYTSTVPGLGALSGGLYSAVVVVVFFENVPQAAPEQPCPETDQTTPAFAVSLVTTAVKEIAGSPCVTAGTGFGRISTLIPEGFTPAPTLAFDALL